MIGADLAPDASHQEETQMSDNRTDSANNDIGGPQGSSEQGSVYQRLAHHMGMSREEVDAVPAAILAGFQARQDVTENHPACYPGIALWADTVAALAVGLGGAGGWKKVEVAGQPRIVSPDGKYAIVVSGGNEHVGIEGDGEELCFNRRRGSVTHTAVQSNHRQLQLSLFPEDDQIIIMQTQQEGEQQVWFLLHYTEPEDGIVRFELSLPIRTNGTTAQCEHRIIFAPLDPNDPLGGRSMQDPSDPPIDVDVTMKG